MTRDPNRGRTLLVGVSNPDTADELVRLSSILADTQPWEILLTHVVTVANQIGLATGRGSPEVVRARDFLQEVQGRAADAGVEARALVEVARSVDEGLLAAAESHRAEMILVGYSGGGPSTTSSEGEERFDRMMHRVARKTQADVVVAKFRGPAFRRILVALTWGAPLRLTGMLCRALSAAEGTSLTFFHAAQQGSDTEEARAHLTARLAKEGLASLGTLEVVAAENPVDAIVEAAEDYDQIILGPSGRPRLLEAIISSRGRKIADGVRASVLLAWGRAEEDPRAAPAALLRD